MQNCSTNRSERNVVVLKKGLFLIYEAEKSVMSCLWVHFEFQKLDFSLEAQYKSFTVEGSGVLHSFLMDHQNGVRKKLPLSSGSR